MGRLCGCAGCGALCMLELTSQYWEIPMETRDKRQDIMAAAEKLLAHRRIHEVTLDDVAKEARVGKGTIYLHFKDKDDLFFEVATSGFDELCGVVRGQVPADIPFDGQLLFLCGAISGYFRERRTLIQMIQAEDARLPGGPGSFGARWLERRRALVDEVAAILARGAADGVIRAGTPPAVLAHHLLGMLRTHNRGLDDFPTEFRTHETVVALFLHGAAAPARGGKRK